MLTKSQTLIKIAALTVVLIVAMVAAVGYILIDVRDTLLQSRQEKVRELVLTARSVADYFEDQANKGLMNAEDAHKQALAVLNHMRFDKDNYFFAYDYDGVLAMIPSRPDLVGQPRWGAKSPDGVLYVQKLIEAAKKGGGLYSYGYDNGGQMKEIRQKISYGTGIDAWHIALGAGIYVDDVDKIYWSKITTFGGFSLALILVSLLIAYLIARSIVGPLADITAGMNELAAGNLDVAVPHTNRRGEIGMLARAFGVFRENAARLASERDAKERAERESIESRQRALKEAAAALEQSVGAATRTVRETCGKAQVDAAEMIEAVGHARNQANTALDRSNHSAAAVQSVASATEELSSSASEIIRQVTVTADSAREADTHASAAIVAVHSLAETAGRIGQIVFLIREVAGRTNLLALNASIEAARAGEQGLGFNVVAQEVKDLAGQTARATGDIAEQVDAIQAAVSETEKVISLVGSAIRRVSSISASVAAAVTQQGSAIEEIGRATVVTTEATGDTATSASSAAATAERAGQLAGSVSQAIGHLTINLDKLGVEVERFIDDLHGDPAAAMAARR